MDNQNPVAKPAIITAYVDPAVAAKVKEAADRDNRSISNLVEWLLIQHLRKEGLIE